MNTHTDTEQNTAINTPVYLLMCFPQLAYCTSLTCHTSLMMCGTVRLKILFTSLLSYSQTTFKQITAFTRKFILISAIKGKVAGFSLMSYQLTSKMRYKCQLCASPKPVYFQTMLGKFTLLCIGKSQMCMLAQQ